MRKKAYEYLGGHSIIHSSPKATGSWQQEYGKHSEPHPSFSEASERTQIERELARIGEEDKRRLQKRRKDSPQKR